MMNQRISSFRRRVTTHFGGRPGRGARYPAPLRAEAVELAREACARGVPLGSLARMLGLGVGTLRRWLDVAGPERQQIRAVDLVAEPAEASCAPRQDGALVLVTVAGHRIEGLSLVEVSRLLEVLG